MALKPILDSIDNLPADVKKEYKKVEGGEHDGKYMLDVTETDGWALENVKGLKKSLSSARTERDAAARIVKELGDDFDIEQYKEALKELEALRKSAKSKVGAEEVEAAKKQLKEKYEKEIKDKDTQLTQRESEISELLITNEAIRALTVHEAISVKMLLPHVLSACRVIRDPSTGKPTAVVMQEDGKTPRISLKQGSDKNMSIDEFVESMKKEKDFAPAFKGHGTKGIGTDNKGGKPENNGAARHSEGSGKSAVEELRESRRAGAT